MKFNGNRPPTNKLALKPRQNTAVRHESVSWRWSINALLKLQIKAQWWPNKLNTITSRRKFPLKGVKTCITKGCRKAKSCRKWAGRITECFPSLSVSLCVSLSLSLSVSLCVSLCLCLPPSLSLCLFLFLSVSVSLSLPPPLCLSLSVCLSVSLSPRLSMAVKSLFHSAKDSTGSALADQQTRCYSIPSSLNPQIHTITSLLGTWRSVTLAHWLWTNTTVSWSGDGLHKCW